MANEIQAVIWDLDGVIIDSGEAHLKAWKKLAKEEGLQFTDEQFWSTFGWRNDAIISTVWGPPVRRERFREGTSMSCSSVSPINCQSTEHWPVVDKKGRMW